MHECLSYARKSGWGGEKLCWGPIGIIRREIGVGMTREYTMVGMIGECTVA